MEVIREWREKVTGVEADIEGDGGEYTIEDIEESEVVAADIMVGRCFDFLGRLLVRGDRWDWKLGDAQT